MLHETLLEQALAWDVETHGASKLEAARRAFEARTGAIDPGARDHEPRIAHFLEHYVCAGPAPLIAAYARRRGELDAGVRTALASLLRSHRSLFVFERFIDAHYGVLRDRLADVPFRFSAREADMRLGAGDCFDGRLLPCGDQLLLSNARVFHPSEAHDALDALLQQLDRSALSAVDLLDALLLMRSRFLQFASVRAEHVYQPRALSPVRLPTRAPVRSS